MEPSGSPREVRPPAPARCRSVAGPGADPVPAGSYPGPGERAAPRPRRRPRPANRSAVAGAPDVPHPHLRVSDERSRLGAAGRGSDRRRPGGGPGPRVGRRGGVQHLLHPRERRQQVLRPPRQSEDVAGEPARHADRGGGVSRPDGQRADPGAGRPRRCRVRDPQPHPGAGTAPAGCVIGPGGRDPRRAAADRRSDGRRSTGGRPGRGEGPSLCGVGDHPDRLRQFLCVLHRPVGPRWRGLASAGRPGGRGACPGPAGCHRGDAARPERELLRAGPDPSPPSVRRTAAIGRSGGGHPPGAVHQPPSEGPPARDDRGHGRDGRGLQPSPSPVAVGLRRRSSPPCAAATPRHGTWPDWAKPVRPSRTWP